MSRSADFALRSYVFTQQQEHADNMPTRSKPIHMCAIKHSPVIKLKWQHNQFLLHSKLDEVRRSEGTEWIKWVKSIIRHCHGYLGRCFSYGVLIDKWLENVALWLKDLASQLPDVTSAMVSGMLVRLQKVETPIRICPGSFHNQVWPVKKY